MPKYVVIVCSCCGSEIRGSRPSSKGWTEIIIDDQVRELCPECKVKITKFINDMIMKQGEESAQTKTTSTDDGSGNAG